MLLGKVYARTARVMFAEGLYRESAKLLKLDASRQAQVGGAWCQSVPVASHHPTICIAATRI